MFLEISQNSQESTCARVSFLIKLQIPCLKKKLLHICFPVNIAKFLRTPFVTKHLLLVPASELAHSQSFHFYCPRLSWKLFTYWSSKTQYRFLNIIIYYCRFYFIVKPMQIWKTIDKNVFIYANVFTISQLSIF